jgi:hypothetical protein
MDAQRRTQQAIAGDLSHRLQVGRSEIDLPHQRDAPRRARIGVRIRFQQFEGPASLAGDLIGALQHRLRQQSGAIVFGIEAEPVGEVDSARDRRCDSEDAGEREQCGGPAHSLPNASPLRARSGRRA